MQTVYIKNTLSGEKEEFKPIVEGRLGMYVCGPTVYGDPHMGHARSALTFDIVFRYMEFIGYKVRYVRNITDVGHLEDEENDAGEDKILKKARLEQLEPMEVAQYYTNVYRSALAKMNIKNPSIEPTASGHIMEQIKITEDLIANGFAYEVNGSVYFDVRKYAEKHDYGKLSGRVLEELMEGSRELENQSEKRHSVDFALWKKASPEHIMKWPSPWSVGFPGWHVECTAMSSKYLGVPFDLHGGGMDLKFPHHEAEIAQCTGANGKTTANYWMHHNMVTLDGQKMAKSKGNFITLAELFNGDHKLLEKAYQPNVVRYFMLQSHYSSPIDFSNQALQGAEKALQRLGESWNRIQKVELNQFGENPAFAENFNPLIDRLYETMNDDFNTALTIATLNEISGLFNTISNQQNDWANSDKTTLQKLIEAFSSFAFDVLGLEFEAEQTGGAQNELLEIIANIRSQARADKNYALSDLIRDKLKEAGIQVQDR